MIPELKLEEMRRELEEEMIEEEKKKDKRRRCLKCDKPLTTSTFRDESGEVIGWTTECLSCGFFEER